MSGRDCRTCRGAAALEERDCVECGGSGWHPPSRDPDRICGSCVRPLWFGKRGPKWYTNIADPAANDPICEPCFIAFLEQLVFRRPAKRKRISDSESINLGDALARQRRT